MQNLLVFGLEHGDHLPVLILLLLGLHLSSSVPTLEIRSLVLSPAKFPDTLVQISLSLLHKAAILVLLKTDRCNIFLGLTPELQIFLSQPN